MRLIKIPTLIFTTILILFLFSSCLEKEIASINLIGTWEHSIESNSDNYNKIIYLVSYKEDGTFNSIAHGFLKSNSTPNKFATFVIVEKGNWKYDEDSFESEIVESELVNLFGDQDFCNLIKELYKTMEEKIFNNEFDASCKIEPIDQNSFISVCVNNSGETNKYKWRKISSY